MGFDEIRQIAAWLAATDIATLELRGPTQVLRLRRSGGEVVEVDGETDADPAGVVAGSPSEDAVTVDAPSLGVFLRRHPLRGDDLAVPGASVVAGQGIGLLQVGPLLLAVVAPADGVVLDVLVPHDTAVGYGTPLLRLQPQPEA